MLRMRNLSAAPLLDQEGFNREVSTEVSFCKGRAPIASFQVDINTLLQEFLHPLKVALVRSTEDAGFGSLLLQEANRGLVTMENG
eukprot:Skav215669  [mRNA]  locus=scaffold310:134297:139193:+ [translate_table: standard]